MNITDVIQSYSFVSHTGLFAVLLSTLVALVVYRFLHNIASVSVSDGVLSSWLQSVLYTFYALLFLLWLSFNITFILTFSFNMKTQDLRYVSLFLELSFASLFAWLVLQSINFAEQRVHDAGEYMDPRAESTVFIAFQLAKMLVYVFFFIAVLSILDLRELAVSIFTAGALGTVLIGLAAREALSNVFSSIMLLFDRPFKPKDFIFIPEKNIEGVVENIGWRITKIRRPDKMVQYVPNILFSTSSVVNFSQMSQRRIRQHFGLRYDDALKVDAICQELEASFSTIDFVDRRVDSFACLHSFDDSQVTVRLQVFTKPCSYKQYNKAIDVILTKVIDVVHKHKAGFAFPTTTLDAKDLVAAIRKKNQ